VTVSDFNLLQHWYPVAPVEDMPTDRPTPVTIAGIAIVLWQPHHGDRKMEFCAAIDRCPHRLAPLSEGRLDDTSGNLMCSYHGWQFDDGGRCTRIPQAPNPEILDKTPDQFCLTSLPVRVAQALIWVWPDAEHPDLAETTPLPLSPLLTQRDPAGADDPEIVCTSFMRDLPYDWQTLVENVSDPSHVPFAHHGLQGNRDTAGPNPLTIHQSTPTYIEARSSNGFLTSTISLEPPCRLEYTLKFASGKTLGLITYSLPTEPGKSRLVAQFSRNFAQNVSGLTPRWWEHTKLRNTVLDSDMVLLYNQERSMRGYPANAWKSVYTMPTGSDRLVIEFRRWFDVHADERLRSLTTDAPIAPEPLSRRELLDRYHQHTEICSSCRTALDRVQWGQRAALLVLALTLTVAATASEAIGVMGRGAAFAVAIAAIVAYGGLKYWLEPRFYFVDYRHPDH
jgi:phenylpropionate dioxygenase-like ring-hydroxylating dioxygenase large terminal subunit